MDQVPKAWVGQVVVVVHGPEGRKHRCVLLDATDKGLLVSAAPEKSDGDAEIWFPFTSISRLMRPAQRGTEYPGEDVAEQSTAPEPITFESV